MKLTKQECKIILKAVELIDEGTGRYACLALSRIERSLTGFHGSYSALAQRYVWFYFGDRDVGKAWEEFDGVPMEELKEWRMNNLLLFMYAESEGEG